jgi:cell division protease FtsH
LKIFKKVLSLFNKPRLNEILDMKFWKYILIWLLLIIGITLVFEYSGTNPQDSNQSDQLAEKAETIPFSSFINHVNNDEVSEITIANNQITGELASGERFTTKSILYSDLLNKIADKNIKVTVEESQVKPEGGGIGSFIFNVLPTVLWIIVLVLLLRSLTSGPGKAMGFGKSKVKLIEENRPKVTFKDVAGIDEPKQEVTEIVDFLKNPERFTRLGARIPKGVLLVGEPGNGKTLLARAIAGEAEVPFYYISGSDFVEVFVGVGASRVRNLFEQAKKNSPCIIFIDEIDAIGGHRSADFRGGHQEREQTLNQLLIEMDGFETHENVILIGATNRLDILDKALLRPGRFDRQVMIPTPDLKGREQIISLYLKKIKFAADVDAKTIARGTPGFTGAELENLVNEAALLAARADKRKVTTEDMEEARDKILMGPERKSLIRTKEDLERTAYHEAGHALCTLRLPVVDPIHKATIIPRGMSLGMVQQLPENDAVSISREKLEAEIVVFMAGRAAEEIFFGREKVSSGAASDIKYATEKIRRAVTMGGMSDKIGPVSYEDVNKDYTITHYSNEMKQLIDSEVKRIIEEAYTKAKKMLTDSKALAEKIAKALLEHETLSGDELKLLMEGKEIRKTTASKTSETKTGTLDLK